MNKYKNYANTFYWIGVFMHGAWIIVFLCIPGMIASILGYVTLGTWIIGFPITQSLIKKGKFVASAVTRMILLYDLFSILSGIFLLIGLKHSDGPTNYASCRSEFNTLVQRRKKKFITNEYYQERMKELKSKIEENIDLLGKRVNNLDESFNEKKVSTSDYNAKMIKYMKDINTYQDLLEEEEFKKLGAN